MNELADGITLEHIAAALDLYEQTTRLIANAGGIEESVWRIVATADVHPMQQALARMREVWDW